MKKLLLTAMIAACFVSTSAGAASEPEPCGDFSPDVAQAIAQQSALAMKERIANKEGDWDAAEGIDAPAVDIKSLSCIDKYKKFKIMISLSWPTIDSLFDKLESMACNYVDSKVNQMTSKLSSNLKLPYGLGGSFGIGQGRSGSGSNPIDFDTRNRDISNRVIGGIFK